MVVRWHGDSFTSGVGRYAVIALLVGASLVAPAGAETTAVIGFPPPSFEHSAAPASLVCPQGTYLAGLAAGFPIVSGLSPYCGAMAADGSWQGAAQLYSDQMMGLPDTFSQSMYLLCPRDFFVSAFSGYTDVLGERPVTQLTLVCSQLKTGAVTGVGTQYRDSIAQTQWPRITCAANEVANGVVGLTAATDVLQFGLSCGMTLPAQLALRHDLVTGLPPQLLTPVNVTYAPSGQQVTVSWQIPPGLQSTRIGGYVIEERPEAPGTEWHALGNVGGANTSTYSTSVVRLDGTESLMRVCAEASVIGGRACSNATRVGAVTAVPVGPSMAEHLAAGAVSPGKFAPVTPKFENAELRTPPPGTFVPPPVPIDVRFAAWATKVTAAWKLSGANPQLIDDYSVEESADNTAEGWRRLGSVPRGGSPDYSARVVRTASDSSWLRVCAERQSMRSCSQPVRVVSTPPQQSLRNDRANTFRSFIPPAPGAGH